jgi:hypothetical protein
MMDSGNFSKIHFISKLSKSLPSLGSSDDRRAKAMSVIEACGGMGRDV